MFSKKTSAFRSITNSLGITKEEPTAWSRFKAGASQFWEADKATAGRFFETDHQRRLETIRARNEFTVGIAWPGQAKAEPSAVGAVIGWALENPEKVVAAATIGYAAGKWVADRVSAGAPKGEPDAAE